MLKQLPANIRTSLLLFSYYPMIKNIKILQLDANFTAALLSHLKLVRLKNKEILYRQEDPSEEVFFISKGSIRMVNENQDDIYSLMEGTYFGEIEVLEGVNVFYQTVNLT
jgi:CRP-like cAMP-binding protein